MVNEFIYATVVGSLYKDYKVSSKQSTNREYVRFIVTVYNPKTTAMKRSYSSLECTIWEPALINAFKSLNPSNRDRLFLSGQLFLEEYNGRVYAKMYVRDFHSLSDNKETISTNVVGNDIDSKPLDNQLALSEDDLDF